MKLGFGQGVAAGVVSAIWGLAGACGPAPASEASVALLADRTSAAPGTEVRLAVRFELPEEAYIYWRDAGAAGEATSVAWSGPEVVRFGEVHYPNPEKEEVRPGVRANVMKGEPILVCSMTVSERARAGEELGIRADVTYSMGSSEAEPRKRALELVLPVVAPGQSAEPANEEVFEEAAYWRPVAIEKAKYINLRVGLKAGGDSPGADQRISFDVEVKKGFHIQAHEPGVEGLVGADLFFVPPAGVSVGEPSFPPGKPREVKFLGTVREYGGKVTFEAPVSRTSDSAGPARLYGLLLYQACDDKTGMCYPPEYVEWSVQVPAVR